MPITVGHDTAKTRKTLKVGDKTYAYYSIAAAEAAGADTPMGRLAQGLYETFVEREGGSGRDFSAVLPWFERRRRGG